MVFSRPFVKNSNDNNRNPSIYTKLPTRSRHSAAFTSRHPRNSESSPTKPSNAEHAKNRSVSLPDPASQKIPPSPSSNRTPRPTSLCTPSRLPRPSVTSALRSQHRHSASLDSSQTLTTPLRMKTPGTNFTPRRVSTTLASADRSVAKPQPQPPLHINVPVVPSIPSSTSQPLMPAPEPRMFSKRDPKRILNDLKSLVGPGEVENMIKYLPLDVMLAIHERELMEGAARFQRTKPVKEGFVASDFGDSSSGPIGVFGFPLHQIALYASTKAVLGGFEHTLPIVVFACVEELYRSGISTPSNPTPTSPSPIKFTQRTLSSSPPNSIESAQPRVQVLLAIFDSPSHKFGSLASLKDEASDDIYTLLTVFLSRLPEPVLAPLEILQGLRNALWSWCVKPQGVGPASQAANRIRVAQMLLGLLPTPNLSLFVYLMAFSCQVLEVRMKKRRRASAARDAMVREAEGFSSLEAQMLALERELEGKNEREKEKKKLGRAWGVWLFGKDQGSEFSSDSDTPEEDGRSTQMMSWLVTNWSDIIRGFFERGISVNADLPFSDLYPHDTLVSHVNANLVQGLGLITIPVNTGGSDAGDWGKGIASAGAKEIPSIVQQQDSVPVIDSLFASSMSLNQLTSDPSVSSPNATPRLPPPPCPSPLKMGLVRGQSYGKPNSQTFVSSEAKQGSIHSRYSSYSAKDNSSIGGGNESGNEHESEVMEKEMSQSSVSALDERLLDLRLSAESEVNTSRFLLRDETSFIIDKLSPTRLNSGPDSLSPSRLLRVINQSDSEYSEDSDPSADLVDNTPILTYSSGSDSEQEEELSNSIDMNTNITKRTCSSCADDCLTHLYVKDLEMQVAALVKEIEMLKLGLGSHGSYA